MTAKFVKITTLTSQTAAIVARRPGQVMVLGSQVVTAVAGGEVLRVYGSGPLFVSTGDWDVLTIAAGDRPDLTPWGQASSAVGAVIPAMGERAAVTVLSGTGTKLTITASAGTGMYRLTEGTHTGFMPGDGVPQIIVHDPERTLQLVTDKTLSDYQITLEETG